jgi:hypothetical protein
MQRKGTLPAILLGAAGAILLVAHPAQAATCDAYCDNTLGCSGGCSIDQENCSVICLESGCDVECSSAPRTCGGGGRLYCSQRPPVNSPSITQQSLAEPPEPGWALLRYELRPGVPLVSDHMTAVGASSVEFAQFAMMTEARLANEDMAKFQQTSKRVQEIALTGLREILFVAPRHTCNRLRSALKSRRFAGELTRSPQTVYFRATTDGSGRVASLDVLYSEAAEVETQRIVAFGEENLQVWSRQTPSLPLEVFGSLHVTPDGKVGYMLEAGNSLF